MRASIRVPKEAKKPHISSALVPSANPILERFASDLVKALVLLQDDGV